MPAGRTAADREPVQIEFFGLPGSGKTTIAREVHSLLASRGQTTTYAPDITRDHAAALPRTLARGLLIARRLPWQRASWPPVRAVAAVGQPSLHDKSKALFNTMTVAALYAELDRAASSAVIDQGMLQAIWSVHLRARDGFSAGRWSPLLDREAGQPRLYASVETPAATCRHRLDGRSGKHSRMQTDAALHDPALWEHAEALRQDLLDALHAAFQRRGLPPRVLTVDGTADPAAIAADILRRIEASAAPPSIRSRTGRCR